ncbi:ABC transporter ATP-binding protein [Nonomuraea sp. NPDC050540]|uniref:ABC transporter ATP-binding protein n=1 Tax=Nonomuraea sp. NPDC050540 TaxID=3364367 RepID=UPI00379128AE
MRWTSADRLLARTARAGWWWNIPLFTVNLIRAAGALALPAVLAAAIDERLAKEEGHTAITQLTGLVLLLLAAEVVNQLIAPWCVSTLVLGLRRDFLTHILRLGTRERARFAGGDLTSRLLTNTTETASVVPLFSSWITSLLVSGGALIALALIDLRLSAAFVVGAPVAALVIRSFVGRVSPLLTTYLEIQGRMSGRLAEVLAGIRTVRAAGSETQEIDRVLADLPDLHRAGHDSWILQGKLSLRASLLMPLIQVAVLATAGYALVGGDITPGQLTAAAAYAGMALGLLSQAGAFMALAQARAGARRLEEVLSTPTMSYGTRTLPESPGELTFQGLTVNGVLDGVTLRVPGGSSLALVGLSGSGKSTLAAVAGRLTDPDAGQVLLDGVPVRELAAAELAAHVSWAFERPCYLEGTFTDAIGFGSGDRVRDAAQAAQADAFIRRLPQGYDSECASTPLSGGERQRLGLARALARTSRLLILDDALSSVDSVTELHISKALTQQVTATRIIVTHRPSLAARADRVAWLEDGRLRAVAPHHELWKQPRYRRLFNPGQEREFSDAS